MIYNIINSVGHANLYFYAGKWIYFNSRYSIKKTESQNKKQTGKMSYRADILWS